MASAKPLIAALKGEAIVPAPVWLMRQAGRYLPEYRAVRARAGGFLDLCHSPELAAEVTLQPVRRFGLDAAILFADILLIPDALGQELSFAEGEGPRLAPPLAAEDLDRLTFRRFEERLSPVYETVRRAKAGLDDRTALIGFAGAPWTVATYMAEGSGSPDQKAARLWAYRDERSFGRLIDLLVEATVAYLAGQVEAGVDALQLFDTWAGSLSPAGFARWSQAPIERIAAALKARFPNVPIIAFPRGAGANAASLARSRHIDAIGLDTSTPRAWAREALAPHAVLQGNIDPLLLVAGGAPLETDIADLLSAFAGLPHIVNLGHGIVPETPPEHVAELVAAVRRPSAGGN